MALTLLFLLDASGRRLQPERLLRASAPALAEEVFERALPSRHNIRKSKEQREISALACHSLGRAGAMQRTCQRVSKA